MIFWTIFSSLCVVAWIYLIFLRQGYWHARERLAGQTHVRGMGQSVVVLIPARNEEEMIGQTLEAIASLTYDGPLKTVVINDHSTDNTAAIIHEASTKLTSLMTIEPPDLPNGWSGKLWALQNGFDRLNNDPPDFILLIDADIKLKEDTLAKLVTKATTENRALVSLMAQLDSRGHWGGFLIPAFIYFFQKLYPFSATNDSLSSTAAAAGGCALVRYDALSEIDGFRSFKDALIDDCALARAIKGAPSQNAIWLGLAIDEAVSLRDNRSLKSVWSMVERTAFTQLNYSWLKLSGTIIAMTVIYIGPFVALAAGIIRGSAPLSLAGLFAIVLMLFSYWPTLRSYNKSAFVAISLPIAAILYTGMTISSAFKHAMNKGGEWKGRTYSSQI